MPDNTPSIEAKTREHLGSRYTKRLRNQGRMPGVLYGHKKNTLAIDIDSKTLLRHLHNGSLLFNMNIDGKKETALVKDLQFGHMGDNVIHVDFARVDLDETITTMVTIRFTGTPKAASGDSLFEIIRPEIEVRCPARSIPEEIKVDVTELTDALTIADLDLPADVEAVLEGYRHVAHITQAGPDEKEGEEVDLQSSSEPEVLSEKKDDKNEDNNS